MGHDQHRHGRADRRGPVGRPARLQPRLPRQRAVAGLHVRRLGPPDREDLTADGVRPCRHPGRLPRQAGVAVLVLLRLQRLEQQARGRLGEHPARLQRLAPPSRRYRRRRTRSATASTRAQNVPNGATASSRSSTAPTRSSTRRWARTPTTTTRPLPRAKRRRRRRLRRHGRPVRRRSGPTSRSSRRLSTTSVKFPWLGFHGRWGERQRAFFNGPTGPNDKASWTAPISAADDTWRDDSYAIPDGDQIGRTTTSFFCSAIGAGSSLLTAIVGDPSPSLLVLAVVIVAVALARLPDPLEPGDAVPGSSATVVGSH